MNFSSKLFSLNCVSLSIQILVVISNLILISLVIMSSKWKSIKIFLFNQMKIWKIAKIHETLCSARNLRLFLFFVKQFFIDLQRIKSCITHKSKQTEFLQVRPACLLFFCVNIKTIGTSIQVLIAPNEVQQINEIQ